jgi:hypothetical protein
MEREHAAQRSVLAALSDDAAEGVRYPTDLVEELAWCMRGLVKEIDEDEAELFRDDALGVH